MIFPFHILTKNACQDTKKYSTQLKLNVLIEDIFHLHQEIKKCLSQSYKHWASALSSGTI